MQKLEDVKQTIQKVVINGKEGYFYEGKFVDIQFKWLIVCAELIKRGYVLHFHYDNDEIVERPKFSLDPKTGDVAPMQPLKMEVFEKQKVRVRQDLDQLFGKKYKTQLVRKLETVNLRGLDPEPTETLDMMGLVM